MTYVLLNIKIGSMKVSVKNKDLILSKLTQNGGRITTNEITSLGIHRQFIKQMADSGELIKVGRGIYQKPEFVEDELYDIQTEYKSGIYSYETSLYLFNLIERVPFEWTMTFRGKYHSEKLKARGIRLKLSTPELFEVGKVCSNTPGNHSVWAYCPERTLCEILKPRSLTDIQVITYAYKEYIKRKDKNIPLLMEMAQKFNVEKKVRSYIEVLV